MYIGVKKKESNDKKRVCVCVCVCVCVHSRLCLRCVATCVSVQVHRGCGAVCKKYWVVQVLIAAAPRPGAQPSWHCCATFLALQTGPRRCPFRAAGGLQRNFSILGRGVLMF